MSPAPTSSTQPTAGTGCITGLVLVGAVVADLLLRGSRWWPFEWTLLFAGVLLALATLGSRLRSRFAPARVPAAIAVTAPVLALVTLFELHVPLVGEAASPLEAREGLAWLVGLSLLGVVYSVELGVVALREALGWNAARTVRALRGAGRMAAAFAMMLLVIAAMRARRPPLSADRWLASLPVVARLPPAGSELSLVTIGSREVDRANGPTGCTAYVDGKKLWTPRSVDHGSWSRAPEPTLCDALVVREDAAHGLWILSHARSVDQEPFASTGMFPAHREPIPVSVHAVDVPGTFRPPDAFTALALIGLLAALRIARSRPPLPSDDRLCRDAIAQPDGTLRFADDTPPLPSPAGGGHAPGPVVAVLAEPAESFRDNAIPTVVRVVPGTLEELRFADPIRQHGLALAWVAVACTPLAAALLILG